MKNITYYAIAFGYDHMLRPTYGVIIPSNIKVADIITDTLPGYMGLLHHGFCHSLYEGPDRKQARMAISHLKPNRELNKLLRMNRQLVRKQKALDELIERTFS